MKKGIIKRIINEVGRLNEINFKINAIKVAGEENPLYPHSIVMGKGKAITITEKPSKNRLQANGLISKLN